MDRTDRKTKDVFLAIPFMGKRNRIVCPNCGSKVKISELKPVFKEEYVNPDGSLKISKDEVLRGGWLTKVLKGIACPE